VRKLFLLIFLLSSFCIYAEDTFRFNFNIAATGFGINYSSDYDDNFELFAELLSVGIEHKDTNIGIRFSPLKYWIFTFEDKVNLKNDKQRLSFFNFNVNWNILDRKNLFLGPFCSINYMFLESARMKWNEYTFTSGMRFSLLFNIFKESVLYHFISSEIGYRNIDGANKFHFNITVDLVTLLYFIVYYGGGYGFTNNNYNRNR
jgi:hypothetical protein